MNLPEKMKFLRKSIGLNQTEFGRKLGLTQSAVVHIEKGKTMELSESTKILLDLRFGVNISFLESDSDDTEKLFINDSVINEPTPRYCLYEDCIDKDKRIKELEEMIKSINKLTSTI